MKRVLLLSVAVCVAVCAEATAHQVSEEMPLSPWGGSCVCQQHCPENTCSEINGTLVASLVSALLTTQTTQSELLTGALRSLQQQYQDQHEELEELNDQLQQLATNLAGKLDRLGGMADKVDTIQEDVAEVKTSVDAARPPPEYQNVWRVFHAQSPDGSYRLSLSEARELCTSKGATLATYTQLEAAFRQGLNTCACGWLADGRAAYAMQWPQDGCGGPDTDPGIRFCGWSDKWNAYCFTPIED